MLLLYVSIHCTEGITAGSYQEKHREKVKTRETARTDLYPTRCGLINMSGKADKI
jgi:hypothetical protein